MVSQSPSPTPAPLTWFAGDATDALRAQPGGPRAYLLNVVNGACTKLAEKLAGPDLVLPWLRGAIAAPAGIAAPSPPPPASRRR